MHPSMPSSILELKQTISEIRKDTAFDTAWTPGHCGIEFNVAADLLAKQALQDSRQIAKMGSPPPDELCPRQDYRAFLEHKVRQIAATEWITLNVQTRPASNKQALPLWRLHGVRGTSLSADKAQSMLKDSRSYM